MQNLKPTNHLALNNISVNDSKKSPTQSVKNQSEQQDIEKNDIKSLNKLNVSIDLVKGQGNRAILQANRDASVSAGNESMQLLYKVAIENINKVLDADGIDNNVIQNSYDSGLDVSPQATADRILSMSIAFFPQFTDQHPEMSDEQGLNSFVEKITEGINRGFSEAKDILQGLNVLVGDIAENIDTTYELVQQGLQLLVDEMR